MPVEQAPQDVRALRSFELRSLAKQLNTDATTLTKELRCLLQTVDDIRSVLFGLAEDAKARERLGKRNRSCGLPGRGGRPCRGRARVPGGRCARHSVLSGEIPRA